MKISTKGIYALEIMVDLALCEEDNDGQCLEKIKNIAARRELSEKYLERIISLLKKAGLVASVRGAYGGYFLARSADQISVLDVLCAVEGDLAPVQCLINPEECGLVGGVCPTKGTWSDVWELIKDTVRETTIADIKKLTLVI